MPEQSDRDRRPAVREQPRRDCVGYAAVRARPAAARRADAERHPQGWGARSDEDGALVARSREPVADALVVQLRRRGEHAGAVHREHRGRGDDCRRVDGAAARRWPWRRTRRRSRGTGGCGTTRGDTAIRGDTARCDSGSGRSSRNRRAACRQRPRQRHRSHAGVLAEDLRARGRQLYDRESAQRVQQDVRER